MKIFHHVSQPLIQPNQFWAYFKQNIVKNIHTNAKLTTHYKATMGNPDTVSQKPGLNVYLKT